MSGLLESPLGDDILNSWAEIATYVHRGLRTVQRWESELGLPVRRRPGKQRAGVMAFRSEIDHWLRTCPTDITGLGKDGFLPGSEERLLQTTADLISRSRSLRAELARTRSDLAGLRQEVRLSVTRLLTKLTGDQPEAEIESCETVEAA